MTNYILLLHAAEDGATHSVEYYAERFAAWLSGVGLGGAFKLEREHSNLPVLNLACAPDIARAIEAHDDVDVVTPDQSLAAHFANA